MTQGWQSRRDEAHQTEFFLTGMTLFRAWWVLPFTDAYKVAPSVYQNITFAPQQIWGLIALAVGLNQWRAACSSNLSTRKHAAWLTSMQWYAVAGLYFSSNPSALLYWGSCAFIGYQGSWVMGRMGRKQGVAKAIEQAKG